MKSAPFTDNNWGADLTDMKLISNFNKNLRFLLRVINIYSEYAWAILLKDKQGITITNAFENFLKESNRKLKKIWVEQRSECYKENHQWNHG